MDSSKNSQRVEAGTPEEAPNRSKNSRRGWGVKNGTPSAPSVDTPRGVSVTEDAGQIACVRKAHPGDIHHGKTTPLDKRQGCDARDEPNTPGGGGVEHDDTPDNADILALSRRLTALRRARRRSVVRGAFLVFLPPVLLCLPLVILKACNLLLVNWFWVFSPLLLWLLPAVDIVAIFIRAYRLARADKDNAAGR